ncbi:MAG: hypothetical protein KBC07_02500 [Bacteroidales bacterium]|jgi:hypothetical protein|nr:hypothetical protein [Bacteroidales bacterium]NLH23658.1 hypothetical protein [Bacteroidales bacterium]
MERDLFESIKKAVQAEVQSIIDRFDKLSEVQGLIEQAQGILNPQEPKKPKEPETPQESKIGSFTMSEIRKLRDARKAEERGHIRPAVRGLNSEQPSRGLKK